MYLIYYFQLIQRRMSGPESGGLLERTDKWDESYWEDRKMEGGQASEVEGAHAPFPRLLHPCVFSSKHFRGPSIDNSFQVQF